jgi:hypothetical protein
VFQAVAIGSRSRLSPEMRIRILIRRLRLAVTVPDFVTVANCGEQGGVGGKQS